MYVVYNNGKMNHPIGELFQKVNDGQYHIIRFIRNGANASIQVDDWEVQPKIASGQYSQRLGS